MLQPSSPVHPIHLLTHPFTPIPTHLSNTHTNTQPLQLVPRIHERYAEVLLGSKGDFEAAVRHFIQVTNRLMRRGRVAYFIFRGRPNEGSFPTLRTKQGCPLLQTHKHIHQAETPPPLVLARFHRFFPSELTPAQLPPSLRQQLAKQPSSSTSGAYVASHLITSGESHNEYRID